MSVSDSENEQHPVAEPDLSGTYSAADYLTWKVDEMMELIRGKIFKMSPAPSSWHQRIYSDLYSVFERQRKEMDPCSIWQAPTDVYLVHPGEDFRQTRNVVQPDFFIVCDQEKIQEKGCIGAPDLVVEILSPSTRKKDATLKLELYQEYGVREYWMISVKERMILIHQLDNEGKYQPKTPVVEGEVITPRDFPQIKVDVEALFAKVPKDEV